MSLLEEKGAELAKRAFAAELEFGDPTIPDEIGKAIGATSTTLQEAYLTALRIIRASQRAGDLLDRIIDGRKRGEIVKSLESTLEDDPSTMHGSH
jgi:hypothetical protein